MPTPHRETLLCRYHYDPLDRLFDSTPFEQPTQRYYCKTRLATEIQGGVHRSILQHDDKLLAQQQRDGTTMTATLLATDQQRSVLNALDANRPSPLAYSSYGHRAPENSLLSLLGFNGERPDPVTGHYHLGNGYRQFNPVLMRFNSPDSWSPFGEGGINAYAYCSGDPINRADPNGRKWGNIAKTINKKLAKESGTALAPAASEHTIKAIDDLFKKAGGKAKFFKNFKKSNPTRTKFTAEALRRQTYATKSDMPDFKQLKTFREPELADMISITKDRIDDLVRKQEILFDVNRLVSRDHSRPTYNLNTAILDNKRFL